MPNFIIVSQAICDHAKLFKDLSLL